MLLETENAGTIETIDVDAVMALPTNGHIVKGIIMVPWMLTNRYPALETVVVATIPMAMETPIEMETTITTTAAEEEEEEEAATAAAEGAEGGETTTEIATAIATETRVTTS